MMGMYVLYIYNTCMQQMILLVGGLNVQAYQRATCIFFRGVVRPLKLCPRPQRYAAKKPKSSWSLEEKFQTRLDNGKSVNMGVSIFMGVPQCSIVGRFIREIPFING